MRNHGWFGAVVLSLSAVACGGADADEAVGSSTGAIQGGQIDESKTHTFAVGVANKAGGVCSGTLIAPNLVLTARHCVIPPSADESVTCADKFPKNVAASEMFVTTESSLFRARRYYGAKEIITPTETGFCGNDIALILLSQNVPDAEAKPATPVVQFKMTDHSKIDGTITAIGFGITSPSSNDSGIRRLRENIIITCIPGDPDETFSCDGSFNESDAEFITQGYVCSGDSGGGAFDQKSLKAGTPYVLGALSRGPQTAQKCLAAVYSRTDEHSDLIIAAGEKAAEAGGYEKPGWLSPLGTTPDPDAPGAAGCEGEGCTTDVASTEPPAATTTTTTTGCSTSPANGRSEPAMTLLGVAIAVSAVARRRRAS